MVYHLCEHLGILNLCIQLNKSENLDSVLTSLCLEEHIDVDILGNFSGKTFQIAGAIGRGRMLVSNEINAARCVTLAANVERLGLRQVVVTNAGAADFGELTPGFFDFIAVDAPCSGEGMFRKTPEAIDEWSPDAPAFCAARQWEILSSVLPALKEGGTLLYSTCTHAPEDNEDTVAHLLSACPALELLPITAPSILALTGPGLPRPGVPAGATRRHYPHTGEGEGQFFALFRLTEPIGESNRKPVREEKPARQNKETQEAITTAKRFLDDLFPTLTLQPTPFKDRIVLSPDSLPFPERLIYASGVTVGEVRKRRLIPHHALFAAYGDECRVKLDYPATSPEIAAYLHGDVFPAPGAPDGWAAILCDGVPLGGIKISQGVAKNHYPKGLRKR